MQVMRILGRSLIDCFLEYVLPLVRAGGDCAPPEADTAAEARGLFDLGLAAAEHMNLVEARALLERAAQGAPRLAGARLLLAAVLSDLGHSARARELLDALVLERPDDARLWFMSGQLAERCGQVERAIECYDTALRRGGRSACQAAERLAAIYLATEDYHAACQKLQWLCSARPEEFRVRVELAGALAALGRHEAAVRVYQEAILLSPEDCQARQDLAAELEVQGRHCEALAELRLVLDEHPHFADLQLRAARLCGRLGDLHGATRHVDAALDANPRYLEAIIFKGLVLTEQGAAEAAIAAFRRAIEVNEDYVVAYAGLALALERSGQHRQSVETLELAQRIAPGSEALYRRLAELGLRMALESQPRNRPDPSSAAAHWTDGYASDRHWDEQGAAVVATARLVQTQKGGADHDATLRLQMEKHARAIKRYPRFADLRYYYGLLLSSLGRTEEAREQYLAAVEINPRYVEALVRLALACWQTGRTDEARHALEKAQQASQGDLRTHYRFGLLWADRGLWPLTMEAVSRLVAAGSSCQAGGPAHQVEAAVVAARQNLGLSETRSQAYLSSLKLSDARDRRVPARAK